MPNLMGRKVLPFIALSRRVAAIVVIACLATAPSMAAPVLQVDDDGILTGALGVDVEGTLYDVRFQTGLCSEVWAGCETSSFDFPSLLSASQAADALLSQVIVGSAFVNDPTRIAGCGSPTMCFILVPYWSSGDSIVTQYVGVRADSPVRAALPISVTDSLTADSRTWAVFAPSVAVPEPASFAMIGGAIAMVGLLRRQRSGRDARTRI